MKKLLTCILVFIMILTVAACQKAPGDSVNTGGTQKQTEQDKDTSTKPKEVPVITYWTELNANTAQVVKNLGETEFAKVWQEKVGVKIEFQHPPAGKVDDAFSILVASGDYPDISSINGLIIRAVPYLQSRTA